MEVRAFRMFHLAEVDCRLRENFLIRNTYYSAQRQTHSLYRLDNNYAILSRKTANKKKTSKIRQHNYSINYKKKDNQQDDTNNNLLSIYPNFAHTF